MDNLGPRYGICQLHENYKGCRRGAKFECGIHCKHFRKINFKRKLIMCMVNSYLQTKLAYCI